MRAKKVPPQEKRCQMRRNDGQQCRAARLKEEEYCLFHHPWTQQQRDRFEELDELPLRESGEIHELLVGAVRAVEAGRMNAQQAYALGWLVRLLQENLPALKEETARHAKEGQVERHEPEFGEATESVAEETTEEKGDDAAEEAGRGQLEEE